MENISYRAEIYRKLFHILLLIFPVSYFFLTKAQLMIFISICAVLIVGLDLSRQKFPKMKVIADKIFGKIFRVHEANDQLSGASYFIIAACITFAFFPKITAITAFTILAISDASASLVGQKISSEKFFEKSRAGSAAFFLSGFIIVIFYGIIFEQSFSYYLFGIFALITTTIVEARPSLLKMDDNLTIPLSFSVVMLLFHMVWIYQY
jgi:dolichol kinase